MNHPRVSIVMPVYNGACFIAEALASVQSEPGIDLEIIVVVTAPPTRPHVSSHPFPIATSASACCSASTEVFRRPATSVSRQLPVSTSPSSIRTTYVLQDVLHVRRKSLQTALTLPPSSARLCCSKS